MADVYIGDHTTLNRQVAIKVLHKHLTGDPTQLARFRAEAQVVAAMRHPNIVQVYDFDIVDDRAYMVMELLPGKSLDEYLDRLHKGGNMLPPETVARIIISLAAALDYAHERGLVHRDIKPGNVILRRESEPLNWETPLTIDVDVVLTDFGLAHLASSTMTAAGSLIGTPAYISPEQAQGEAVDGRSDIYSLGVMLYEMLAGKLPFDAPTETPFSLIVKHITESPPEIPGINSKIQAVLDRVLAKSRDERYQKAGDFAMDLMLGIFGVKVTRHEILEEREKSGSYLPVSLLDGLVETLDLLATQAKAYERALPPNNYTARAAVAALGELARQALNEGRDLGLALVQDQGDLLEHPFTPREQQVLELVALGLTNKEVAYRLGISERTVQFHLNSVFNKIDANSRTEAVALALQKRWIQPS
jgi:serine/threonine protein kinase/DNA-binding CsgD family transcriptional regulator